MILLDTDHLSLLKYTTNPRCQALAARLAVSADRQIGTTIISVEEQWRGCSRSSRVPRTFVVR
jgi:hypothetical protein